MLKFQPVQSQMLYSVPLRYIQVSEVLVRVYGALYTQSGISVTRVFDIFVTK